MMGMVIVGIGISSGMAVIIVVVAASELAEEGQVHDSGHVGGGHSGRDHAHYQHDCVGAVCVAFAFEEAPAAGASEDFIL